MFGRKIYDIFNVLVLLIHVMHCIRLDTGSMLQAQKQGLIELSMSDLVDFRRYTAPLLMDFALKNMNQLIIFFCYKLHLL